MNIRGDSYNNDDIIQNSGIWVGQRFEGEQSENITWNLTITPNTPFPSVFGAPKNAKSILHGTCNYAFKTIAVSEVFCDRNNPTYEYFGTISGSQNVGLVIQGNWSMKGSERKGQFALLKEPDDEQVHLSGVWVGEAIPSPNLAEFFIPTNPIRISGKHTDRILIEKVYEFSEVTEGIVIFYEGALETVNDAVWMKGTWDHPNGGAYGSFSCRKQPIDVISTHLCICSLCNKVLTPGQTRYTCESCFQFGSYCVDCQTTDKVQSHPHKLVPETVYSVTIASGTNTSEMLHSAFTKFSNRPLIGVKSGNAYKYQQFPFFPSYWFTDTKPMNKFSKKYSMCALDSNMSQLVHL